MGESSPFAAKQDYSLLTFAEKHLKKPAPLQSSTGGNPLSLSGGTLKKVESTYSTLKAVGTLKRGLDRSKPRMGPQPDADNPVVMISHTLVPIRDSLLVSTPAPLARNAVKAFIDVMKYMGDFPVKKHRPLKYLQRFAQLGIDEPKIRDELYVQVLKQTYNNPNQ